MTSSTEKKARHRSLIDFHTHILPGVDDGSRSIEQSVQMVRTLFDTGVRCIALTPHFYARHDDPEHFIARRNRAFNELTKALDGAEDIHEMCLIPGAEIEYFDGISCMADYPELKLGESGCILVEMPQDIWSGHMVDDLIELNLRRDCRVVIAHVERYLFKQKRKVIYELLENGITMQSNAEFFIDKHTSKKAIKMFERGYIHLLGSDCHNLTDRVPNIGAACDVIEHRLGEDAVNYIMGRAASLLSVNI